MNFTTVARVQDVPEGKGKQVSVSGKPVALFHLADGWYAIDDTCPHRGGPLSEGAVQGKEVMCPWHGARFDLVAGKHLCPPARSDVACYQVQIVGDEVQIAV